MSEKKISGEFYGTTLKDEEEKLKHINQVTKEKLEITRQSVHSLQEELHELQEVYDVDEKEGLAQWFNTDARFNEVRKDLLRAERAMKKPYFGRIDILDEENGKKETFYIGKTVIGMNPSEPEVIDWRAPISSVYYDHSLGKCNYKVPSEGIFSVDLQRKRTYEIEEDKIKDFYDSDVVANDELLTKYLSKSKRNVLSEIIATIQQEQNEVIRKNPHRNVLIQGSAGSGKTTVAMHRISYILYNFETEFKPESFYIVGSNKVLLNYITGVLPDLDVYGVSQMTMEELFTRLLYEDWDSALYKIRKFDKTEESIGIKSNTAWYEDLKKFASEVEWRHIPREDLRIEENGRLIMKASDIEKALREYPDWAMAAKISRLNDILIGKLENEIYGRYYSYNVEMQKKLMLRYKNYFNRFFWKDSVFELYKTFIDRMRQKNSSLYYEEGAPDLYDLASLAYLYKRIKETEVIQEASHVVIDEAQDFGMSVYESLKYCMSKCTFTIMGDVSQNINLNAGLGDWEELKKVMLPDKYDYFGLLRKSYRNTVEISEFATDVLRHGTFPIYPVEPIIRHGDKVVPVRASERHELNGMVEAKIKDLQEAGHETIAVICKDIKESTLVYETMGKEVGAKLFTDADSEFGNGTVILPIEYSKGLEFDAVVIYDASAKAYPKEDGYAKLLYVAATRALHELSVFYLKNLTGLVADPIPEGRKDITFIEDDFHVKPFVYEEEFKSKEEIAKEQALEGDRERALRDKYGPKRIIVNTKPSIEPKKETKKEPVGIPAKANITRPGSSITLSKDGKVVSTINAGNASVKAPVKSVKKEASKPSEFGSMPEGSLSPVGHSRIDNSVRWTKADKTKVEITGAYGTLQIIPIADETVRVLFAKGMFGNVKAVPEEVAVNKSVKWRSVESRESVEISLPKLKVKVDKKTGAISFISANGSVLLKENDALARQFHGTSDIWWEYFDWSKKEGLGIRGASDVDWKEFNSSARYISHGKDSDRPALIMSSKGYQILVPAGIKVLACTIPAYGPYLKFEDTEMIDYIFRAAR